MKFSLIICTYQRPDALLKLLKSVQLQNFYPNQILVIDGSIDSISQKVLESKKFYNLNYYKVKEQERGLTKQRNIGIQRVAKTSEIVCFLDDDIVLAPDYFKNLINTYSVYPNAIGVGGAIIDEGQWRINPVKKEIKFDEFEMDGYVRKLGSRNILRKRLGLLSDQPPGFMPKFSNGLSTGFLPPSEKTYPVEYFMGGVASYRFSLLQKLEFSNYFEGYGLYEDLDFCTRASRLGDLYVNTAAKLYHNHDNSGRPNKYDYGKMVIRNGWYVWRLKYANPGISAILKWHSISFLLTLVRLGNVITTTDKEEAFTEGVGRIVGWLSLFINSPKIEK